MVKNSRFMRNFDRAWIPNSLTMGSLLCGFGVILLLTKPNPNFGLILWLFFIASWLDIGDGGVARLLRTSSDFGKQLDSLTDTITFVVAPAAAMYAYSLQGAGWWGMGAVILFAGCGISRLARYNLDAPVDSHPHFVGLPTGIATAFAGTIVYSCGIAHAWLAAGLVIVVALLMISAIPFPTPGQILFEAPLAVRFLLAAIWIGGLLHFETWVLMPLSYFLYSLLQSWIPAIGPTSMRDVGFSLYAQ